MTNRRGLVVLAISTWAFTVCFAAWMMFGIIGIPLRQELQLNSTQFGLLTAMPVLTGSVFRLPLGIWTDRFGGRIVMLLLLVLCAVPLWFASYATALWQFLLLGLALGLVGASFSVGTPYVARFFPPERRGFAMGTFGAGTVGAALNMFVAPALMNAYGWQAVPRFYAVVLLLTAGAFWFLAAPDPGVGRGTPTSFRQQLAVLADRRVWKYCQYYSIVFGGFTALSIWMPQYFVSEYGFTVAQAALLAACFSLPGGALRAVGGVLADRFGAHNAWVALFLISYPHTHFTIRTVDGSRSFTIALAPLPFTILLFIVGVAFAFGMASTFKYIGDDFPNNMGAVGGLVGMVGGLGGFLLPIMFGGMLDWLGFNSSCFMLLYSIVAVSLMLSYITEVRRTPILGNIRAGSGPSPRPAEGMAP
jgi:NNP family nitrate/nitrite transporter-like MFS transporter